MPSEFYGGVGVDLLYPSSLDMNQFSEPEWTSANIAPLPATDYTHHHTYPSPADNRPPPIEVSAVPPHMVNIPRPKSSPSTFGPNVEDLLFAENPFKEQSYFPSPQPSRTSSPFIGQEYASSSRGSPARQMPIPIAPDPMGVRQLQSMKRMRDDDEVESLGQQRKRKRAVSATGPVELNEEETLLLKLKEEENLPWKDIAARFQSDLGKTYQVPALQMRFKRLRERMRAWTENDRSKRPMNGGRNAGSTMMHQRCATSAPPNAGPHGTMPGSVRSYTQTAGLPAAAYRPVMPPHSAATLPAYPTVSSLYPTHAPYATISPIGSPYHTPQPMAAPTFTTQPLSLPPTSITTASYPTHGAPVTQAPWTRC